MKRKKTIVQHSTAIETPFATQLHTAISRADKGLSETWTELKSVVRTG